MGLLDLGGPTWCAGLWPGSQALSRAGDGPCTRRARAETSGLLGPGSRPPETRAGPPTTRATPAPPGSSTATVRTSPSHRRTTDHGGAHEEVTTDASSPQLTCRRARSASGFTASLTHVLVHHHPKKQRERVTAEQLIGVVVLGDAEARHTHMVPQAIPAQSIPGTTARRQASCMSDRGPPPDAGAA